MTAVLIVGIVLAALGVAFLIAGSFTRHKQRGDDGLTKGAGGTGFFDVLKPIIDAILAAFKVLPGKGSPQVKAVAIGTIFFLVGIGLIVLYAVNPGEKSEPPPTQQTPSPSSGSSPTATST